MTRNALKRYRMIRNAQSWFLSNTTFEDIRISRIFNKNGRVRLFSMLQLFPQYFTIHDYEYKYLTSSSFLGFFKPHRVQYGCVFPQL